MMALRRLVIDAVLAEADPARQSLEEPVALAELPQRIGGAWRQQPKIAGILRDALAHAPVDQPVKQLAAEPAQPWLVGAVRLGGEDHVVAAVEPMPDQAWDQRRRML